MSFPPLEDVEIEQVRTVLFDMGGVLVELHPSRVFDHWSKSSGSSRSEIVKKWSIEEHYKLYETGQISFSEYIDRLGDLLDIAMDLDDWRIGWNALVGQPYPEVFAHVRELSEAVPVYCFTNSNTEHESIWRDGFRTELSVFTRIYNSSSIGLRKPDQFAFEYVVHDMGFTPQEVLFLDDNSQNVSGARKSGLSAVQIRTPEQTIELLQTLVAELR